jgi:hypothetical protein
MENLLVQARKSGVLTYMHVLQSFPGRELYDTGRTCRFALALIPKESLSSSVSFPGGGSDARSPGGAFSM